MSRFYRLIAFALVAATAGCATTTKPVQQTPPTATTSDTIRQICDITAELLGVNASDVKPSTSLAELAADELDTVELVMELEEHFNVAIPDDAITNVIGNDNWQTGFGELTMTRLAEIVDKQRR